MDNTEAIEHRIRQALSEYGNPRYTPLMENCTRAFQDLAFEYQDWNDFLSLAVLIPKTTLDWDAALYLAETDERAVLSAGTHGDLVMRLSKGENLSLAISVEARQENGYFYFPLPAGSALGTDQNIVNLPPIVGMFGVRPPYRLKNREIGFLEKYTGLLSQAMAHRLTNQKGRQHITFVKNLVADIGHNVIVPNIFFKAYLRRLSGKIKRLLEVQKQLELLNQVPPQNLPSMVRDLSEEMAYTNEGLMEEFENIQKHYINTSLFLETLLRQSHFEQGQYVLQKKTCNFRRDVIGPQMDQYLPKLKAKNIEVDLSMGGVPDQVIEAVVDIGLISQVFANLISNAVKYTQPSPGDRSERKFIAYGLELIQDAFGTGEDGVKINLFSSGQALEPEETEAIFGEGKRGSNIGRERGTGHGLFFVKEVVELHRGRVGHEATPMGNNFYFILPRGRETTLLTTSD